MQRLDEIRRRIARVQASTRAPSTLDTEQLALVDAPFLLALADTLARLVETEPVTDMGGCLCCGVHPAPLPTDDVDHAPDCPWRQARELLADA